MHRGRVERPAPVGTVVVLLLALAAAGFLLHSRWSAQRVSTQFRGLTLRVGADESPPYLHLEKDGSVTGFDVDLLNQAAQRLGMALHWVPIRDTGPREATPDDAVGVSVDLWPALAPTPERRARFHLTAPWLETSYLLVTRHQDHSNAPEGKRIAHARSRSDSAVIATLYPEAQDLSAAGPAAALDMLCRHRADMALLESRIAGNLFLQPPQSCQSVGFAVSYARSTPRQLSLMSSQHFAAAADALRDELARAAHSEALTSALGKWAPLSAPGMQSVLGLRDSEQRRHEIAFGLIGFIAAAALLSLENRRIRKAARRLSEGEARYRKLFDASPLPCWIYDIHSLAFCDVNDAALRRYGYSREEFLSLTLDRVSPPETRSLGKVGPERHRQKNGGEMVVQLSTQDITFANREARMVTVTDAAESTRLAQELEDANLELRAARERAEAINAAGSAFLVTVSQEIRTPMNAIIGMTGLVLETQLTCDQRECLDLVRCSADGLLTTVNDLLDFAKIEAGKFALDPISFNLEDALSDVVNVVAVAAQKKGLEVSWHIQSAVPEILSGDVGRLRQVLTNLIGAAVKFAGKGDIIVRVAVEQFIDSQVALHFSVSATGGGIPPEVHSAISYPLRQPDSSIARRIGGTGLGLAISSRIIELSGGRLWLESQEDKASTFHFTAAYGLVEASLHRSIPKVVEINGLPVLVIDDNANARRILRDTLSDWGLKVTTAETGEQGLAAFHEALAARRPYALIIVDMLMPDLNGFDFAERIGQISKEQRPPMLLLTAAGQRGDAARCREVGIAAYLIKPVKRSELFACVLSALGKQADPAAPSALITRHSLRETRGFLAQESHFSRTAPVTPEDLQSALQPAPLSTS